MLNKTFLFVAVFLLLTGCSAISAKVERSHTEVVTVNGDIMRCEYARGVRFNCEFIKEKVDETNQKKKFDACF